MDHKRNEDIKYSLYILYTKLTRIKIIVIHIFQEGFNNRYLKLILCCQSSGRRRLSINFKRLTDNIQLGTQRDP